MRPVFTDGPTTATPDAHKIFAKACPGVAMTASGEPDAPRDPILGPVRGLWLAWSRDEDFRKRGASGGVLSTLAAWAIEEGIVARTVGATTGPEPRRTVAVEITSREEALRSAGSRYAPCSVAGHPQALSSDAATIGKPCEAYAIRRHQERTGEGPALLLSFFCAGTPSQDATDKTVTDLGLDPHHLSDLWYRGRGWPGRFTAVAPGGASASLSYSESWGSRLGPTVQWRCRVCPDGVGEASDITAGDLWEADEAGHPTFEERPGQSVLIARTELGMEVVRRAIAAGVIATAPLTAAEVHTSQPYQVLRRQRLVGRLAATLLYDKSVTRTGGFGSVRWSMQHPILSWREFRGSVTRLRHRRRSGIRS